MIANCFYLYLNVIANVCKCSFISVFFFKIAIKKIKTFWSIDWLVDWTINGLMDRLIDWLICQSIIRSMDWLINQRMDRSSHRWIDWLIDRSISINQSINQLFDWFIVQYNLFINNHFVIISMPVVRLATPKKFQTTSPRLNMSYKGCQDLR